MQKTSPFLLGLSKKTAAEIKSMIRSQMWKFSHTLAWQASMLCRSELRWTCYIVSLTYEHLPLPNFFKKKNILGYRKSPKNIFLAWFGAGKLVVILKKSYKDMPKTSMKKCGFHINNWENIATNHYFRWSYDSKGIENVQQTIIDKSTHRRTICKAISVLLPFGIS